ncbi:MAG: 2OG-Fe(II) oxygenase [Lishizhenia sp.]
MEKPLETKQWLKWMDEIATKNYVVIDDFLSSAEYELLRSFFIQKLPLFTPAGIGALNDNKIIEDIRGDYTWWLDKKRDFELGAIWEIIDETMFMFNRYCFLGLSGYEFHFANYPPGGHYDKHLDQFKKRNNRTISFVLYLNENWQQGDGGELEIFKEDGSSLLVAPIGARLVMFRSDLVPHAVLQSNKNRYSLTGWLLQTPSPLGQFLG